MLIRTYPNERSPRAGGHLRHCGAAPDESADADRGETSLPAASESPEQAVPQEARYSGVPGSCGDVLKTGSTETA